MTSPISDELEQSALLQVEGDGHDQANSQPTPVPQVQKERPRLSDKELRRRLWRIYEMALIAAKRAEVPPDEDTSSMLDSNK